MRPSKPVQVQISGIGGSPNSGKVTRKRKRCSFALLNNNQQPDVYNEWIINMVPCCIVKDRGQSTEMGIHQQQLIPS